MLALQVAYISIPRDLCVPPINATKTNWNYLSCHCNAPSGHPQYLPTCFLLCITHEVAGEFFNQLKRSRCNTHNFSPEAMFQNHPFSGLYLSGQCRLSTQSPHCLQSWNFPPSCAQFRRGMWIVLHSFWGEICKECNYRGTWWHHLSHYALLLRDTCSRDDEMMKKTIQHYNTNDHIWLLLFILEPKQVTPCTRIIQLSKNAIC